MATPGPISTPGANLDLTAVGPLVRGGKSTLTGNAKARADAVDFESMFLSQMFNHMFTGIDGEGPFGGTGGAGVWRSFLSDAYAKSFAKAGGIGVADHVYRALIAQQEARGH
jgi:peptidoglycan hydrolase FlgJ